ncbi:MAG: aldo/keto reductase [Prolixibacteraceae bacterium]|nr:aldo/keto reductase [Prolixibacteraceae bacterium]
MAESKLSRRIFLGTAAAGVAGAAVSIGGSNALSCKSDTSPKIKKADSGLGYRRLGRTDIMISEVIVGCASGLRSRQLGEVLFNRYRELIPNIVSELIDRGGNAVNTSASYHDTEELLGKALKGRRDKVYIFSSSSPKNDPQSVIESCERSLKRFQTDHLDGFFGHGGWSEGFYEGAKKLQEQGKIRFIGQSAHKPENHVARIEADEVDFIMQPYNYMNLAKWTEKLDGRSAEDLFELCRQKDVGVMVIKPFSGHFIPNWAKDSTDPMVQDLLADLNKFGKKNLYQALLMWVLQNPNVHTAVCGFNEPQDVVEDFEIFKDRRKTAFHEDLLKRYYTLATRDYCRMCETCLPSCPQHIPIPDILRNRMYYKNYGHKEDAREFYANLDKSRCASVCTDCGACEEACPSGVSIMKNLKDAHKLLA